MLIPSKNGASRRLSSRALLQFGDLNTMLFQFKFQLTIWARFSFWLGLCSVAGLVIGTVLHRVEFIGSILFLYSAGIFFVLALLGIVCAIVAYSRIWSRGKSGFVKASWGIVFCSLSLSIPVSYMPAYFSLPEISDITTDVISPPTFSVARDINPPGANSIDEFPPLTLEMQKLHYPHILPLELDESPEQVFHLIEMVVKDFGWTVLEEHAPAGPGTVSRVEAISQTPYVGFKDSIVIRLVRVGSGSRIDMRSASRFGRHDFGANAKRIEDFFEALLRLLEEEKAGIQLLR